MPYESLIKEAQKEHIYIYEKPLHPQIKGLQADNVIWINKNIPTSTEKACILAEEIGHYHTSYGDILDQKDLRKRKQELRARQWAYEKLLPLKKIVQAHKAGVKNRHELADFAGITEPFVDAAISRYIEKHGASVNFEGYIICFEPLGVLEWFEW